MGQCITRGNNMVHLLGYTWCTSVDPENFVRGGITQLWHFCVFFFFSWWGERGSKYIYHLKRTIIGPPAKRHLNDVSLAGWWWSNIKCWLGNFMIASVFLRNPIALWFSSLGFLSEEMIDHRLPIERPSKTLIRLRRCAGWSASSIGAPFAGNQLLQCILVRHT